MLEITTATLEEHKLLPAHGIVVVAVSGGADSLCLLHVLHRLCGRDKRYPLVQLHVAHLNHQLRGADSERDAQAVAQLAQTWGLPYTIGSVDVAALAAQEHRSIEDAARTARYRFLREVAQGQPIAVAHHQDDQVETLLLHWLRGGGLTSMIGLQPRQQDIIRPLLAVTRADTQAYCTEHGLVPLEDITNNDVRYQRNRIRHELLPLLEAMNPGIRETVLRNAEIMQVDLAWIETQVDTHWASIVQTEQPTMLTLSISALLTLPLSLQRHLLRRVTAHLCGGQSPLELRHYRLLEHLMQRKRTMETITLHLPHNLQTTRTGDILVFKSIRDHANREHSVSPSAEVMLPVPGRVVVPNTPWTAQAKWVPEDILKQIRPALQREDWSTVWQLLPVTSHIVYIDGRILEDQLVTAAEQVAMPYALRVRTRQNGDRIQPLGMHHEKKVKEVLIDKHIPREVRDQIPLFFSATHCVWLGGVHLDHRAHLTRETRMIVCLSITHTDDK
jgi:tRNA(Ile)-lysidine synthase